MTARFREAMLQALMAAREPDVEVKISFDDMEDSLEAVRLLIGATDSLGLFDRDRTLRGPGNVIELTNGSCLRLDWADKVWLKDHWVKVLDEPAKTG